MGSDSPASRSKRITERLAELEREVARYRARAIEVHAKLVALEAARGPAVTAMRETLVDSSVRIARGAVALIDSAEPQNANQPSEPAFTRKR
ncbi:MAG TPA: hypothetical protein VFQ53_43225 [Kofleriaceae bacterium]|nr:hypothetical protein [Kofleriaceae bacterium]